MKIDVRRTTKRLVLAPLRAVHVDELHALWTQPAVRKYLWDDETIPLDLTRDIVSRSQNAFEENEFGLWVVSKKNEDGLIGFTGYWPFFDPPQIQLLYGLAEPFWGHGYASEMAQSMIQYGFETHNFETIIAATDPPNEASVRVMERLGMSFWKRETSDGKETLFYTIGRNV